MYLTKIPKLLRNYYAEYTWRMNPNEKTLYLTFDDGPTPEVTPWVLEQLAAYEAGATFFLLGRNVKEQPELAHAIMDQGHSIGNHSFSHKNGWKVEPRAYLRDFLRAQKTLQEYTGYRTQLFRPPYGRITRAQARHIRRTHQIVMMDVVSGDFDLSLEGEDCLQTVLRNAKSGSIISLHDSKKAWDRLQYLLPALLAHFYEKDYRFEALPNEKAQLA